MKVWKEPVLWGREELPLVGHSAPGPSTIFCPSACLKLALRGTFSFSIRGQGDCSTKARVLTGTGVGAIIIWKQRISSAGQRPQGTCSGAKLPSAGMFCPGLQRPTPNTCPFGKTGPFCWQGLSLSDYHKPGLEGNSFISSFLHFSRQGASQCGSGCYGTWFVDTRLASTSQRAASRQ